MELKVTVDGVQRIVCGVTKKTTCQEVVIALAQALGRPGRYSLKEKLKEYERSMTPSEHLLESLEKYGQQAREVQLTLQHLGPSKVEDNVLSSAGTRLRKSEVGSKNWAARRAGYVHRQSLPPLSRLRLDAEPPHTVEAKGQKRKSFTLVEEAKGWLESLGWNGRFQRIQQKEKGLDTEKTESHRCPEGDSGQLSSTVVSQERGNCKSPTVTTHQKRESLLCETDSRAKGSGKNEETKSMQLPTHKVNEEQDALRTLLVCQQASLHELQVQIGAVEAQIKLEEEHQLEKEQEFFQQTVYEEDELQYWENELRAEAAYEQDLQQQFLEMKRKAAECKARLEEYKFRLHGLGEGQNLNFAVPQGEDLDTGYSDSPIRGGFQEGEEKLLQAGNRTESSTTLAPIGEPCSSLGHFLRCQNIHTGPSAPEQLREKCWVRNAMFRCSEVTMYTSSTRV
ncbi:ras association domain-containing protein 8 [Brienomyrus brachyistius]|uniref:ras association domain-containing protein 8 n=1 Tax=Brienomyrus brachyistius TaxID=42636 RepID=UPI0020B2C52B|nr:ras association domain-containing protein 8 [Brienomyrus brachyistius]